jgi:hypothetical protein
VPLPLACQIHHASKEKPYLAVKINIDRQLLSELIVETTTQHTSQLFKARPRIIHPKSVVVLFRQQKPSKNFRSTGDKRTDVSYIEWCTRGFIKSLRSPRPSKLSDSQSDLFYTISIFRKFGSGYFSRKSQHESVVFLHIL